MKLTSLFALFIIANIFTANSQKPKTITNASKKKADSSAVIKKKDGNFGIPVLTVETEISFQYEYFVSGPFSTMPTDPNSWHIESKITCKTSGQIEALPIYLYSEVQPGHSVILENSSTICPKSYAHAFSSEVQDGLTIAPEDLSGKIYTNVALPLHQLDEMPGLSNGGSLPAMVGSHTYTASLTVDKNPIEWGKFSIGPEATVNTSWEFGSIWAVPEKVRSDTMFEMIHLGPVIRSTSAARGDSYLVGVKLRYIPKPSGGNMEQSSVKFIKITPDLSENLSKAFPNCPSVKEFGNAIVKLTVEMKF